MWNRRPTTATDRAITTALAIASSLTLAGAANAVLSINEPWVRASHDGRTAEVFVKLKSSDEATLASVDSFASRAIEMRGADGKRATKSVALPADVLVELKPGGVHLELIGLHRRLKLGQHVPVTLFITSADGLKQTIYINAEVRRRSPSEDEMDPHGSHSHRD